MKGLPINGLSQNRYVYTMNNPVNAVDQEGTYLTYQESPDQAPRCDQPINLSDSGLGSSGIALVPIINTLGSAADKGAAQALKTATKKRTKVRVPQSITNHADEVLLDTGKAAAFMDDIGVAGSMQIGVTVVADVVHYRSNPTLVIGALIVDAVSIVAGIGLAALMVSALPAAIPAVALFWLDVGISAAVGFSVDAVATGVKRRAFDPFVK